MQCKDHNKLIYLSISTSIYISQILLFIIYLSIYQDNWAKGENDSRKTEIKNLDNFAHTENDARKVNNIDTFFALYRY